MKWRSLEKSKWFVKRALVCFNADISTINATMSSIKILNSLFISCCSHGQTTNNDGKFYFKLTTNCTHNTRYSVFFFATHFAILLSI